MDKLRIDVVSTQSIFCNLCVLNFKRSFTWKQFFNDIKFQAPGLNITSAHPPASPFNENFVNCSETSQFEIVITRGHCSIYNKKVSNKILLSSTHMTDVLLSTICCFDFILVMRVKFSYSLVNPASFPFYFSQLPLRWKSFIFTSLDHFFPRVVCNYKLLLCIK